MSFICHIHNYTEYNQQWNVFSAFKPSKCTHTLEQWAILVVGKCVASVVAQSKSRRKKLQVFTLLGLHTRAERFRFRAS